MNSKTIATSVEGAVHWHLLDRRAEPLHAIRIDEVSGGKVTIVYDHGRGRVVWVGRDHDAPTVERFSPGSAHAGRAQFTRPPATSRMY